MSIFTAVYEGQCTIARAAASLQSRPVPGWSLIWWPRRGRRDDPDGALADFTSAREPRKRLGHMVRERRLRKNRWYLAGGMVLIVGLAIPLVVATVLFSHRDFASGHAQRQGGPSKFYSGELNAIQSLKLLNYYPARSSWQYMWEDFHPRVIAQDMTRIAKLHANGVRIIIPTTAFGFPNLHRWALSDLHQVVEMAHNHGLRVQLTLFDHFSGWNDIQDSRKWAATLLAPYAGNGEIAFIELHNEIDPADSAQMTWCRDLLPYVKARARGIPVTVSVTNGVSTLVGLRHELAQIRPDFWDLHYYGPAGAAYATFAEARAAVRPSRLYIGEFGFSTWPGNASSVPGLPSLQRDLDTYQAYYYASVEAATKALRLPAAAPWALYDFSRQHAPLQPSPAQYSYGIFRLNGSAKPAATVIREFFSTGHVNTSFNQDFAQPVGNVGSLPAGWQLHQRGGGTFAWDPAVAYGGGASARLSSTDATCPAYSVTPPDGFVQPGQSVSVSVHARGLNATGSSGLSLTWMNMQGQPVNEASRPRPAVLLRDGTTAWTSLQAKATAPAGAAYAEIDLMSCANRGTVWFAHVQFSPAPVAARS
jgi:hypothetical protein